MLDKPAVNKKEYPKLPTFRQFLKTLNKAQHKAITNTLFSVSVIFLPNQFKVITFVTDKFRLLVTDEDTITEYLAGLVELSDTSVCLCVRVTDVESEEYVLTTHPKTKSVWSVESYGYKIQEVK